MTERSRRRKQKPVDFPHGQKRSGDNAQRVGSVERVRDELGMVPVSPELVQKIRVREAPTP